MSERTALYRLFDAGGELLYVGIGVDPKTRWNAHSRDKAWWQQVVRKSVEWHPTRADAMAAETKSIRAEEPRFNVVGTPEHGDRIRQAHASPDVRERQRRRQERAGMQALTPTPLLIARIRKEALARGLTCEPIRQHGGVCLWRFGSSQVVIPAQNRIPEAVAERIASTLEPEFGECWWQHNSK